MSDDPKPLDNPLETLVGYQLRRASAALMGGVARALERLELKPTEASVLVLIAANPGITQSEIGRTLSIKRANMAPIAARLEKSGLLVRQRVDGRSHGLTVTDAGATRAHDAVAAMEHHDEQLLARIAPSARADLRGTLGSLWTGSADDA